VGEREAKPTSLGGLAALDLPRSGPKPGAAVDRADPASDGSDAERSDPVGVERRPAEPARTASGRSDAVPATASSSEFDEATLLLRARQLRRRDPEAALRLIEQHKQRFPSGMLAPEREVLAIQLLRALARPELARARVSAFAMQFPNSPYLQRLSAP
jgi:hypothetical protein